MHPQKMNCNGKIKFLDTKGASWWCLAYNRQIHSVDVETALPKCQRFSLDIFGQEEKGSVKDPNENAQYYL